MNKYLKSLDDEGIKNCPTSEEMTEKPITLISSTPLGVTTASLSKTEDLPGPEAQESMYLSQKKVIVRRFKLKK